MGDGPNFNSVLIAIFGFLTFAVQCWHNYRMSALNTRMRQNTDLTAEAAHFAHLAADQTNGVLHAAIEQKANELLRNHLVRMKCFVPEPEPGAAAPPVGSTQAGS